MDNTYSTPGAGAGGYNAPGTGYNQPTYGQPTYGGGGQRVDFDFNIPMDGQVEVLFESFEFDELLSTDTVQLNQF